jgi:hypothetical protein
MPLLLVALLPLIALLAHFLLLPMRAVARSSLPMKRETREASRGHFPGRGGCASLGRAEGVAVRVLLQLLQATFGRSGALRPFPVERSAADCNWRGHVDRD